jgi:predicted TIM-barrel fold metal-dependent hydrolase
MIINAHSHLFHDNMTPDPIKEVNLNNLVKTLNVPREILLQNPDIQNSYNADAEKYIKTLDETGIEKGIVMGLDWGMSIAGEAEWSVEEMNQWVANQVAKHPDKLYGVCFVDPRRGDRAIKLVEKAIGDWGMKGVKIFPPCGFYPDDPKWFPLYKKCVELDVPLFSHTGIWGVPLMGTKYADPIYLDEVAAKFPDLNIVMVHFGGPYWIEKGLQILLARPNMYADISANQLIAFSNPERYFRILSSVFGTIAKSRIMFGTDWPLFEQTFKDKDWVEWVKNIPEKAKEYDLMIKRSDIRNLLGNNAEKLLKL